MRKAAGERRPQEGIGRAGIEEQIEPPAAVQLRSHHHLPPSSQEPPQQWDCIAVPPECAHRFESEQSVLVIDGYREESKLVEAKAAIDGRIVSAEVVREPDSEDWRLAPGHSVDLH